jgi:hypothetical protein
VRYQTRANWTNPLPSIETACPNQMGKKFFAQRGPVTGYCSSVIISDQFQATLTAEAKVGAKGYEMKT